LSTSESIIPLVLILTALHAIKEPHDVEVDQQPDGQIAQLQLGEHLPPINLHQRLHALQLHDDAAFDDDVDVVERFQLHAFVDDWHPALKFELQLLCGQFVRHAFFVHVLEYSWTHDVVHANATHDARDSAPVRSMATWQT